MHNPAAVLENDTHTNSNGTLTYKQIPLSRPEGQTL